MSSTAYEWPYQPKPERKDREAWQRVLQLVYDVNQRDKTFAKKLWKYTKQGRKLSDWVFDQTNNSLYQREENQWRRWKSTIQRRRRQMYQRTNELEPRIEWNGI